MKVTLFVYGTLAPGQDAWPRLERRARAVRAAAVPGRLYDTGHGYPAAVFAPGEALVHGWCCEIDDALISELDPFEGSEYERVHVTTSDGTPVVAYAWRAPLAGCRPVESGRWLDAAPGAGGPAARGG